MFEIISFSNTDLALPHKVTHFVSLGPSGGVQIPRMLFDMLESFHENGECVGRYGLADLRYNRRTRTLALVISVGKRPFTIPGYLENMDDAGSVLSSLFRYDQNRVICCVSNILVTPNSANNANAILPKFMQLLVHDLQHGIKKYPGAGIDKRRRMYFKKHIACLTAPERFVYWLSMELYFEYQGGTGKGETEFDKFFKSGKITNWCAHPEEWSAAFRLAKGYRDYDLMSLGNQWSNAKNWLSHAMNKTTDKIPAKQAEAHCHRIFEWLMYQVRLELCFPGAVQTWNEGPIPPEQHVVIQKTYFLPKGLGNEPLIFADDFTMEELLGIKDALNGE